MDELLTDLVPFSGNIDTIFDWDNFTTPTVNSLYRMMRRQAIRTGWINGISYRDLNGLKTSDLTDYSLIDQREKEQVITELRDIFSIFETDGLEGTTISALDPNYLNGFPSDAINAAQNLEDLLMAILDEHQGYQEVDDRTLAILRGRIPAFLKSYRTLDDIGMEFHVTRERIRQIESKYQNIELVKIRKSHNLLEKLILILESSSSQKAFADSASVSNLLRNESISATKLKAILQILGLEELILRFEAVEANWDLNITAKGVLEAQARAYRNKFGLIDLLVFTSDTNTTNLQAFSAIKRVYPRSIMQGDLVLARTANIDTTFENVVGKQLKVFGELDAEVLLVGIQRQAAYRQVSILGSKIDQLALINEIAGVTPSYESFQIGSKSEPELSLTDIWFLELLQNSPNGMLHRSEISSAAIRDKKNLTSVSVFSLFNPLLRPVGAGVLALANVKVDAEVARRHAAIARAAQELTFLEYSFSGSDIILKIIPNINTMGSGILFPPRELREMIKDVAFSVVCSCEKLISNQQLRLTADDFWTGFTAAIRHFMNLHDFVKGDQLVIWLNFQTKIATCRVS